MSSERTERPPVIDPTPLPLIWWLCVPVMSAVGSAVVLGWDLDTDLVLRLNERWPAVTGGELWMNLTAIGGGAVASAFMLPFVVRRPRLLWAILLSSLLVLVVGEVVQHLVPRLRPPKVIPRDVLHVLGPRRKHNAFPSGHTATIFMAAALWVRIVPFAAGRVAVIAFAALVGISRVVVGVHWPTDVLAGATVGWVGGHAGWAWAGRWTAGMKRIPQLVIWALMMLAAVSLYFDDAGFDRLLPVQLVAATAGLCLAFPAWWRLLKNREADA